MHKKSLFDKTLATCTNLFALGTVAYFFLSGDKSACCLADHKQAFGDIILQALHPLEAVIAIYFGAFLLLVVKVMYTQQHALRKRSR